MLHCVVDEIGQHLRQAILVGDHRERLQSTQADPLAACAALSLSGDAFHKEPQRRGLALQYEPRLALGEHEQVGYQPGHPLHLKLRFGQAFRPGGRLIHLLQQVEVGLQGEQWVPKLMGGIRYELAMGPERVINGHEEVIDRSGELANLGGCSLNVQSPAKSRVLEIRAA